MKKNNSQKISAIIGFIIIFFFSLLFSFPHAIAEDITLVVGDWAPHIDQNAPNQGYMTEIVVRAFRRVGVEAIIEYHPWTKVSSMVDDASYMSFSWIWNEERGRKWLFSETISDGIIVFVAKKGSGINWKTFEDITPYRIGVAAGYSYGTGFDSMRDKLTLTTVIINEEHFTNLLADRIDLFPINRANYSLIMRTKITPHDRKIFKILSPPLTSSSSHLVCGKKFPQGTYFISKFNKGLRLIMKDGTKQRIINKSLSLD